MRSLHFLYHELRPVASRYSYVTPCEEFEAHCELFSRLRNGNAANMLRPEITFDDGHASDLLFAQPILRRYGLQATFFITAGWTGRRKEFLSWQQVRELYASGQRIGAHGMTHKLLTTCSPKELEEELQGARKRLEDGIGAEVKTMSLPGGRFSAGVLRSCEQAGYREIFTSVPRSEEMDRSPATVGRLNLLAGTSVAWMERVLDVHSGALTRLERKAKLKDAAKQLLGDRLYARIWAIGNRQETPSPDAAKVLPQ